VDVLGTPSAEIWKTYRYQGFVRVVRKVLNLKWIEDFAGQSGRVLPIWAA